MKFFKEIGRLIARITGKPTTTKSVVGEVANAAARATGKGNPEIAEAVAERIVDAVKGKGKRK